MVRCSHTFDHVVYISRNLPLPAGPDLMIILYAYMSSSRSTQNVKKINPNENLWFARPRTKDTMSLNLGDNVAHICVPLFAIIIVFLTLNLLKSTLHLISMLP